MRASIAPGSPGMRPRTPTVRSRRDRSLRAALRRRCRPGTSPGRRCAIRDAAEARAQHHVFRCCPVRNKVARSRARREHSCVSLHCRMCRTAIRLLLHTVPVGWRHPFVVVVSVEPTREAGVTRTTIRSLRGRMTEHTLGGFRRVRIRPRRRVRVTMATSEPGDLELVSTIQSVRCMRGFPTHGPPGGRTRRG